MEYSPACLPAKWKAIVAILTTTTTTPILNKNRLLRIDLWTPCPASGRKGSRRLYPKIAKRSETFAELILKYEVRCCLALFLGAILIGVWKPNFSSTFSWLWKSDPSAAQKSILRWIAFKKNHQRSIHRSSAVVSSLPFSLYQLYPGPNKSVIMEHFLSWL